MTFKGNRTILCNFLHKIGQRRPWKPIKLEQLLQNFRHVTLKWFLSISFSQVDYSLFVMWTSMKLPFCFLLQLDCKEIGTKFFPTLLQGGPKMFQWVKTAFFKRMPSTYPESSTELSQCGDSTVRLFQLQKMVKCLDFFFWQFQWTCPSLTQIWETHTIISHAHWINFQKLYKTTNNFSS